jgi:hypothetical protein
MNGAEDNSGGQGKDKIIIRRKLTLPRRAYIGGLLITALIFSSCATKIDVKEMEIQVGRPTADDPGREKMFKSDTDQECEQSKQKMEAIKDYIISLNECGEYEPLSLILSENKCFFNIDQPGHQEVSKLGSSHRLIKCSDSYIKNGGKELAIRTKGFEKHIQAILNKLFSGDVKQKRLFIFVHGGLTGPDESRSRAIRDSYIVSQNQYNDHPDEVSYYPLFINWRSDFANSYRHQIEDMRQGEEIGRVEGFLSAPLFFISDITQAVARIPATWYKYTRTLFKTKVLKNVVECKEEHNIEGETVICEEYDRNFSDKAQRVIRFIPSMPFQYVWVLPTDSFGKTAWINMLRRTQLIMRHPRELDENYVMQLWQEDNSHGEGKTEFNGLSHMAHFFRTLSHRIEENPENKITITLVGHSMGAIVINEILRSFPDLPYQEIVYLAAACSIKDFEQSVVPLLLNPKHATLKFYNVSLDPNAEAREYTVGGLGPTGSLLEWIDSYYTDPPTLLNKTMGKWQNIAIAKHIFPQEARKKMTFKVFAFHKKEQPIQHGQMDDLERCYWRTQYWQESGSDSYNVENCWYK